MENSEKKEIKKIKWRGGALTAPVPPAMITCGDMEKSNIITVAWTGIVNTVPPKTYISVRPSRYSHKIISERREFIVNLTPSRLIKTADLCGMYTGAKVDKFAKYGLTKVECEEVNCPIIAESPMALVCKVSDVIPLGSHDMFIADIVAVYVDGDLVDRQGKLHLESAGLAAFAHGDYFALGKKIGYFGFSVKKKGKK